MTDFVFIAKPKQILMNQIVINEIFTSVSIFCEMQILPTQYTIQSLKIWCKQNGKEQEIVPFVFQWEATLTFKKEICWSEYFTSFQFSISMLYWWLKDGKARLLVLSFAVSKACWVYLFSSAYRLQKRAKTLPFLVYTQPRHQFIFLISAMQCACLYALSVSLVKSTSSVQ